MAGIDAAFVLLFIINPLTIVAVGLLAKELFMSDVQDAVDAITAQLVKVQAEVVKEIAKLEEAVNAGIVPDLTGLKAAADALDSIVPDEVVAPPVDEVPAEEV